MSIFKEPSAPYQRHSETSKEAAELLNPEKMRYAILDKINANHEDGCTGDEISAILRIVPGTVSARLIELERQGSIVRTERKRPTRQNRNAFVYVSTRFTSNYIKQNPVSKTSEKDVLQMLFELMKVSQDGTGVINLSPFDVALFEDIARKLKLKKVKHDQNYLTNPKTYPDKKTG